MKRKKQLLNGIAMSFSILLAETLTAQVQFDFDAHNSNNSLIEEVFDTNPLAVNGAYYVEVTGTYSVWTSSFWSSPCGVPENSPMWISPGNPDYGKVGFDSEYIFALPTFSACSGKTFPYKTSRIEFSVDGGATWFHPSTSTAYNTNHTYTYEVIGKGFGLGVRHLSPHNSDDYGILKFSITQKNFTCNASLDFDTYNTTDTIIDTITDNDSLALGATYSMNVEGTFSAWASSFWTAPCGTTESSEMYDSPGNPDSGDVGSDMEFDFAFPESTRCAGQNPPEYSNRIEISLDNGATWINPTTTDSYNLGHSYDYTVVGQGYPLKVRHNSAFNSDDYGILKFNLSTLCPRKKATNISEVKSKTEIKLYPNPTDKIAIIEGHKNKLLAVKVFTLNGQEHKVNLTQVGDQSRVILDISHLAMGTYIVQIQTAEQMLTKKIIKK